MSQPPRLTQHSTYPTSGVVSFSGLDVILVEKNRSINNIAKEETHSRTSKQGGGKPGCRMLAKWSVPAEEEDSHT